MSALSRTGTNRINHMPYQRKYLSSNNYTMPYEWQQLLMEPSNPVSAPKRHAPTNTIQAPAPYTTTTTNDDVIRNVFPQNFVLDTFIWINLQ